MPDADLDDLRRLLLMYANRFKGTYTAEEIIHALADTIVYIARAEGTATIVKSLRK